MRKFTKNESGTNLGIAYMVGLIIILAVAIAVFVFELGNPETNTNMEQKEKNPNIVYANGSGMVTVHGESPDEVNQLIGEIRQDGCFNKIELGAQYNPIRQNFYASVYISMENQCIKKYS